jgi:hypothetical protein
MCVIANFINRVILEKVDRNEVIEFVKQVKKN